MPVNPFDNAVVSQSLLAAAREMGAKLIRSAYTTILREASDGSCAIATREGDIVAQAELIPIQLGPIGITLKACRAKYPADTITADDFMITNDPYAGGQHLPDVYLFCPIFHQGNLVGFGASVSDTWSVPAMRAVRACCSYRRERGGLRGSRSLRAK